MHTVLSVLLLSVLGVFPAKPAFPPAHTCYVAHRYDDSRVVFSLDRTFANDPELRRRGLAQNPSRLPDPAARLAGMSLWKMGDAFWKRHAGELSGPDPGDRWVLKAGGRTSFHCTIERLAMAEFGCGTTVVALALVDQSERQAFERLSELHYLIIPDSGDVEPAPADPEPVVLREAPPLSGDAKERLESTLEELLKRELPKVRASSAANYALMSQLGRRNPWPHRDERLARAEGKLSYDLQAVRLSPDGQARYYVRAEWVLDKDVAFLLSAWVRPDRDMLIESVNDRPSLWLRMDEFQSERLGLDDLGILLNVFDYDGDGWGEVLMGQRAYEGYHMHLLEYSDSQGFRRTGISYRYGC